MVFSGGGGMRPVIPAKSREALFAYALWYTGKYRVSRAKLMGKLILKTDNSEWIEWVFGQIDPYHSDAAEIRSAFEGVIRIGKPIRPLISKLRTKGFLRDDIDSVAQDFLEQTGEYGIFEGEITRRANTLFMRGYGPRHVEQDLTARYPLFKEEIHALVISREESELLTEYGDHFIEIPIDQKARKKLYDTFVRRGFSYAAVKNFLEG